MSEMPHSNVTLADWRKVRRQGVTDAYVSDVIEDMLIRVRNLESCQVEVFRPVTSSKQKPVPLDVLRSCGAV